MTLRVFKPLTLYGLKSCFPLFFKSGGGRIFVGYLGDIAFFFQRIHNLSGDRLSLIGVRACAPRGIFQLVPKPNRPQRFLIAFGNAATLREIQSVPKRSSPLTRPDLLR